MDPVTPCEAAEILIEHRLHGGLDAAGSAVLDAHLAGCAACRSYAEVAEAQDRALRQAGETVATSADWNRLERSVRRSLRSSAARVLFDLLSGAVVAPLALWGLVPEARWPAVMPAALAGVLTTAFIRAVFHGWLARRALALRPGEELLAFHRATLRADLWRIRVGRWLAMAVALALGAGALLAEVARARAVLGGFALLVAATWFYVMARRAPRLRRQLADLDVDVDGERG